MVVLHLQI